MTSKRYNKLPKKTKELPAEVIEKLIPELKKIVRVNSMSQQI